MLKTLNFDSAILASEYAKYYFYMRSMSIRSAQYNAGGSSSSNHSGSMGSSEDLMEISLPSSPVPADTSNNNH